jgi:hypothetical protein
VVFWGLIGTGVALEAIGVPLLAAESTSDGWRVVGIALVALGGILVLAALVVLVVRRGSHNQRPLPPLSALAVMQSVEIPTTRGGTSTSVDRRPRMRIPPEPFGFGRCATRSVTFCGAAIR